LLLGTKTPLLATSQTSLPTANPPANFPTSPSLTLVLNLKKPKYPSVMSLWEFMPIKKNKVKKFVFHPSVREQGDFLARLG